MNQAALKFQPGYAGHSDIANVDRARWGAPRAGSVRMAGLVFAAMFAVALPAYAQRGGGGGGGGSHGGGGGGGGSYARGGGWGGGESHSSSGSAHTSAAHGAKGTVSGGRPGAAGYTGAKKETGIGGALRRFFGFSHPSSDPSATRAAAQASLPPAFSRVRLGQSGFETPDSRVLTKTASASFISRQPAGTAPPRPILPRPPGYPILFGGYGGYGGLYPGFGFGFGFFDYFDYFNWFGPGLPSSNYAVQPNAPAVMFLYLNDRSAIEATDYWVEGDVLHYISPDGRERQIRVSDVDLQRTTDANARLGFRFTLDRTHRGTPLDISPDSGGMTNPDSFAPHLNEPPDAPAPMGALAGAMQSTAPVNALDVGISRVILHAGTQTADLIVQIGSKNLKFLSAADGNEAANLKVEAASLDQNGNILAGQTETIKFSAPAQDPSLLPDFTWHIRVTIPLPSTAETVRVAVEDQHGGQIGTANVDRETMDAAPAAGMPIPHVTQASAASASPATQ
jgi:hypothetical protein